MVTKQWCTIQVCGSRNYTVEAVSRIPGSDLTGDCTYTKGKIRVLFAEESHMEDTLLHEITHAVWDACGLRDTLRRRLGHVLTPSQIDDLEEDIMVAQTPGLLATLKLAGWLTLPAAPTKDGE